MIPYFVDTGLTLSPKFRLSRGEESTRKSLRVKKMRDWAIQDLNL